jgi:hypothetical protein
MSNNALVANSTIMNQVSSSVISKINPLNYGNIYSLLTINKPPSGISTNVYSVVDTFLNPTSKTSGYILMNVHFVCNIADTVNVSFLVNGASQTFPFPSLQVATTNTPFSFIIPVSLLPNNVNNIVVLSFTTTLGTNKISAFYNSMQYNVLL